MIAVRLLLLVLAFLPITAKAEAGFWESLRAMIWKTDSKTPPMIDVLIVNDKPRVLLEIKGRYQLLDPHTKELISKRYMGKKKIIEPLSSGIKWGEEFPGIFQLQIIPDESGAIAIDNVEYQGSITIYDIGGTISIVNRVPIEDYLLSTLPSKYQTPLPEETLSAIAIAARTEVYYQSRNPKSRFWAIEGDSAGYAGSKSASQESEMAHAIKATRHMILTKTGTHEGNLTPFPAVWEGQNGDNAGVSQISIAEAEKMALEGSHAAQILSKAFPGGHIEIIY